MREETKLESDGLIKARKICACECACVYSEREGELSRERELFGSQRD